jgi:3,2-trans-enoyl-CoA isomerase
MLRRLLNTTRTGVVSKRAASQIITELHPENDEVAIVKMNAPPINALSRPFLAELEAAIDTLEKDEDVRAMVLTSQNPGIFSAGLDIFEMYGKDQESLGAFWTQLQDTWLKLYKSPLLTVAAINGTSPAGGCLLSISCDHRIMHDHKKFNIGLNETKLGLVAPPWFAKPFIDCIGHREAEKALYLGTLYPVDDALKVGLIDEKCALGENIIDVAVERAETYLEVPDFARIGTKQNITRKETIEWFDTIREADVKVFQAIVGQKKVQQALGMYVQMLKAKAKK